MDRRRRGRRRYRLPARVLAGARRDRVEAYRLALQFGPLAALAQVEESGKRSGAPGDGGGLGAVTTAMVWRHPIAVSMLLNGYSRVLVTRPLCRKRLVYVF